MPLIDPIVNQNFELVRDRIATILADEFSINLVDGKVPKVYTERTERLDHTNMPAVNIVFATATNPSLDNACNTYNYSFNIDCYANGVTSVSNAASKNSAVALHRLIAIVKQVLLNQVYKNLLYSNAVVENRSVETITVADYFQNEDAKASSMARVVYSVKLSDDMQLGDSVEAQEMNTRVTISESDSGYLWQVIS